MQVNEVPLLPIPVTTEKRPDPRLALTIGVAGWIAQPQDFGEFLMPLSCPLSDAGDKIILLEFGINVLPVLADSATAVFFCKALS